MPRVTWAGKRALLLVAVAIVALVGLLVLPRAVPAGATDAAPPYVTLEGRAVLPADTFAPGPPSGAAIPERANLNGRTAPFASQPVQGFSSVLPKWNGNYLAMSDNGFGSKRNSPDYRLRWYEVAVDGASGSVEIVGYTELSDPDGLIPWPIVNGDTDRVLTGADFDLESFRQAPDGTFWFGEEFGPYLLHTDVTGRLLQPPISVPYPPELQPYARGLPYVQSPDHPDFAGLASDNERRAAANQPRSRGLEGMALSDDGTKLYPMLEGPMVEDPVATRVTIQEFDLATGQFTGNYWFYPLHQSRHAIGELTALTSSQMLVIERDSQQGAEAAFKHIYRIDLNRVDAARNLEKTLLVDLLAITDNQGLTQPEPGAVGLGPVFSFPFITIESVHPVRDDLLLVVNDNNYPLSTGRRPDAPDNTEFILVRLYE